MLPKNFRPEGLYDLIRLGSDHDGGYLVDPNSVQESKALLALGIGKNWSFEKDFLDKKIVTIHAYDYSVGTIFWVKHFIKRFLSIFIGRFNAPYDAVILFLEFRKFFNEEATLYLEKIGSNSNENTNLDETVSRLGKKPFFLKADIEGYEYQILEEIIGFKDDLSGLVIEFHKVSENRNRIEQFINDIDLQLIHIHPNNNRFDQDGDPQCIELTFSKNPIKLNDEFEAPNPLDQDNVPRKNPIQLRFSEV